MNRKAVKAAKAVPHDPYAHIDYVLEIRNHMAGWREMIGWDHRNLVWFNGRRYKRLTVLESLKMFIRMEKKAYSIKHTDIASMEAPKIRWLNLIQKELL